MTATSTPPPTTTPPPASTPDTPPKFGARDVVHLALDRFELGRSTDGLLFAVERSPRTAKVAHEIGALRHILSATLWNERELSAGRDTLTGALETLRGLATTARVTPVHIRSARVGAALHVDLATTDGTFVEVSPYGWEVRNPDAEDDATAARPVFRRTSATRALPVPVGGGSRDDLRELLGFAADDPRWRLAWGWLVASLFADVPRPILWALGQSGSGKSTRARMLLSVVDPVDALGREPGKNERDDITSAAGRFLVSYDNLGKVSASTSDFICRLVTGVEDARRALFTDDDLRVPTIRRSGVATSIVLPFGLGPDALERLVLLELERMPESSRQGEKSLWAEFAKAHPRILGALLDDVAGVLAHLSAATAERRERPRMADYANILAALDMHLGLDADEPASFALTYADSVRAVMADRAQSDPLTAALLKLAATFKGGFEGAADVILRRIDGDRPDDPRAGWPPNARSLSAALTTNAETLRAAGLLVTRRKSNGERLIKLTIVPDAEEDDSPASPADNVVPFAAREAHNAEATAAPKSSVSALRGADLSVLYDV